MNSTMKIALAIVVIVIIVAGVAAYVFLSTPSASEAIILNGAGATFPQPFLNATITTYTGIHTNVKINYPGGGSGQGMRETLE